MTEKNIGQEDQLIDATIGELRALAKSYGIKAQRDWDKPRFIKEIAAKQEAGVTPDLSSSGVDEDEADRLIAHYSLPTENKTAKANSGLPKPGFARIILHRDPTPGHANSAVQIGLNGKFYNVPRGIPVDLPIPFLGVLRDAVHKVRRQVKEPNGENLDGVVTEEEQLSYPFQIVSITPGGKFSNSEDQRAATAHRRKAFHDVMKRWPTDGELAEWEKANAARAARSI